MRTSLVLGALALNALVRQGVAHPLCYYDAKPTDPDQVLVFCQPQEEGSCCNDLEEIISITWYQEFFPEGSDATEECKNLYKQVSFVARIVGRLMIVYDGTDKVEHVLRTIDTAPGRASMKVRIEAPE